MVGSLREDPLLQQTLIEVCSTCKSFLQRDWKSEQLNPYHLGIWLSPYSNVANCQISPLDFERKISPLDQA